MESRLESITGAFDYSKESFLADADKRAGNACSDFEYTLDGFTAVFDNRGEDNLLFFSVPFDEGWRAEVNGKPAEIEQVNTGFMAVRVKGGQRSDIRFTYRTPWLRAGMIVSVTGAALCLLYLIINKGFGAKRKPRKIYRIKQKSNETDRKQRAFDKLLGILKNIGSKQGD